MRHYFVDTNIVLDMLANREGYAYAACELFDAAGRGEIEDANQYFSACNDVSICGIITRNRKDFKLSQIPVLLPEEYES